MSRKAKSELSNDHSRVVSAKQLAESAQENILKVEYLRLEDKCKSLSQTIDLMLQQLEIKEEEISQLKNMLNKGPQSPGDLTISPISDEELIADVQLRKIRDNAKIRELTLDEIKKFDILVKNKRLAQGNVTDIQGQKGLPRDVSPKMLLEIASKKPENKPEE